VCVCVSATTIATGRLDSTRLTARSCSLSLSLSVHAASPKNLFLGQKIYDECDWLIATRVIEEAEERRETARITFTCVAREWFEAGHFKLQRRAITSRLALFAKKKEKMAHAKSASGECEENVRPSDNKRLSTIANCRQRVAGEKVRHFFFSESMIRRRTHDAYNVQWSRLFRYGRISRGDVTRAIRIFAFLVLALRKSSTRESLHLLRLLSILSRLLYLGSSHRFSRVASFAHVCLLFLTQSARDEPRTYTRRLLGSKFYRASSTTKSSSNIKRRSLNFCFVSNAYINIYEYQMPLFLRYIATPTSCRLHNACRLAIFFEDISRHGSAVSVIRL